MAGGNPPPKHPHQSPFSSAQSNHRKPQSRWESSSSAVAAANNKSKPSPNPHNNKDSLHKPSISKPSPRPEKNPNPSSIIVPNLPFPDPPPPPSYGFHMLERRSIVLVDGSVRSYFALPPDYENFKPNFRPGFRPELPPFQLGRNPENWNGPQKRKFGEEERVEGRNDGFERQRQQLLQYGNANGPGSSVGHGHGHGLGRDEEVRAAKNMRVHDGGNVGKLKHGEVSQGDLKKAFYHFVKLVFENVSQRKKYLADGKQGPLPCLACSRASKDFPDAHSLVMHAYNTDTADSVVDHLGFHKALCVLMGWNYLMPPDNSKAYQKLSSDEAEANRDDMIMWPPSVLIHNTIIGKGRDGRMEGTGNRAMDGILRDLGFTSGKSMSLYSREGHLGIHAVKFSSDESGLKEALRLAEYFEREKRGRKAWAHVQSATQGKDDENNPNLVVLDRHTGEKKRIFYGHMATVADLDKVTFEIKKKVSIASRREFRQSK